VCGQNVDFHPQQHPYFTYLKSADLQIRILPVAYDKCLIAGCHRNEHLIAKYSP